MSKKKERKLYDGQIPFNVFGDQLHYPNGGAYELKAKNFKEDGVYILTTSYPEETYAKIFFQDVVKEFAEPKMSRWGDELKGIKDVIGEIEGVIWLDNNTFEDTLVYDGYARGRSAAYFHFKSKKDGRKYTVFLTDFENMVFKMANGEITGKFTFCKRGQNYGTILI